MPAGKTKKERKRGGGGREEERKRKGFVLITFTLSFIFFPLPFFPVGIRENKSLWKTHREERKDRRELSWDFPRPPLPFSPPTWIFIKSVIFY